MGKKLVYFEDRPQDSRKAMLVGDMNLTAVFLAWTIFLCRYFCHRTIVYLRLTVDILHRSILYATTVLSISTGTIFFFFSISNARR